MAIRRSRALLVVGALLLAWLAVVLPHLARDWMRVLAFIGIVALAAWGWGRPLRAKTPDARPIDAVPQDDVAADALPPEVAPDLAVELAPHKLAD